MSTLGLSGPPQQTDGLWRGLFWPTIQNAQDIDLAATRGFWICFAIAFGSATITGRNVSIEFGLNVENALDLAVFLFYFLGAIGVRQTSFAAAAAMLVSYLLGTILYFWVSPFHFSFFRLVGLALLLTNLRGALLIRKWKSDVRRQEDFEYAPSRQNETWRDKLVDQMPLRVWPLGKAIFYALALALIPLETYGIAQLIRHS